MKTSCREYTLPQSEETSRVVETRRSAKSWMWRYAFIKDVTVLGSWSNLFFETEQFLGLRIVNGIDKYVTETSQEIPIGSVENGRTGKPVAKAKPRPKPTFTLTPPVPILHHERKWIDIDPGQFRQGFLEVSKFMISSSRRRWSSKIWRPGRKNQGKVCWYFAMDNWSLDCFPGKRRRTEEKGFSTAWTLIFWTFPVFPTNPIQGHSGGTLVDPTLQDNVLYWCNLKVAQRKGLQFYQTRSHAIAFFNTQPAICTEKVENMKTGEDLYCKVHQSPRLPRVVLTPYSQYGRQNPPHPEVRKSTDHQSGQSVKYTETCRSLFEHTRRNHRGESQWWKFRETCRGNVDSRIPGFPHSTLQKEDSNRKETVKRLIQQFENHPNRDSLIQHLNKTEKVNPISAKSKELITSMGNTEYFELCGTSSKIQCPDCALSAAHAASACSLQKGFDSWTRQDTTSCEFPATSRLRYQKRILPMVPDMDHLCGRCTTKHMICWGKPASTKVVFTKPFWKDGTMMTSTVSLCQILGGMRNGSFNVMKSHWKIIPTWPHGKKEVGTRYHGTFLCQKTVWRTYRNHWRRKQTNPCCTTSQAPTWSTIWRPRRIRLPTWTSYRMAILPFFQDGAFILVIALAAELRLEVKSTLGFVANIILDWTVIFSSLFRDVISLAGM